MGIRSRIVNPTPWPDMYKFLLGNDVRDASDLGAKGLKDADVLVVLDISDVKRLGVLAEAVRRLAIPKLVIDHHLPSDEPPSQLMVTDTTACATGELIYDFAICLGLSIAGQLIAAGVEPEEMYGRLYASMPVGRLHLLRDALATLEVDPEYGISWISVAAGAAEEYGLKSEDLEGIAEHPRSIGGTRLALFFRDLGHDKVKVSFRSTGDVDVNKFAKLFGGGGHARAAGALIDGNIESVRHKVVAAAREFLRAEDKEGVA